MSDRVNAVVSAYEAKRLEMPHIRHVLDSSPGLTGLSDPFDHLLAAAVFTDSVVLDLANLTQGALLTSAIPREPGE